MTHVRYGAICVLLVASLHAQVEQATVTGTVTDQTGAVVPGASVVVHNQETGVEQKSQTNPDGHYTVPYLHPGSYAVVVQKDGFSRARVTGVNLTVGLVATVDVQLSLGTVQNEVRVEAAAVQLEQQSASLGNVVGSSQMIELPLLGRNVYTLVNLAPGVLPTGGNAGTGPIINGGRSNTSEILFDGAETRNTTTNDISYSPPLESVQEFKVITNSFSSEYGRSGGGVLTAASRSGTNQLHGSAYEFLRNDKLNANGWNNNRSGLKKTAYRRNEYGFAVGGPVYLPRIYDGRNATFFFLNWEQIQQRSPANTIATVPTAAERVGDFSRTLAANGQLTSIYDPDTTRPDPTRSGRYIRDQFPANRIPQSRIHPIAQRVLEFYPLPNRETRTQNFARNGSSRNDTWRLFLRLDHTAGKHHFFFSHGREDREQGQVPVNIAFPAAVNTAVFPPRSGVLSDTVTFRPNLLGEFRASAVRRAKTTTPPSLGYDFSQLGFPKSLVSTARYLMFPSFSVTDVAALGPDRAEYSHQIDNTFEFQGHMTWIHGSHSLKSGFDYTFNGDNPLAPEAPSGSYSFSRTFTQGPDPITSSGAAGFGVATLLLGAPTGGSFSFDPELAASQRYYAYYLQDDWKIRRNLTLNLGMRWEYSTPWTERFNQLGFFDPNYVDPLTRQKGLLRFVGRDGNPRQQTNPDKNNFAPRVGLAWQFARQTVLRAGYGMFHFPGSGGIGSSPSGLGGGFLTQTSVYLGPPPAAPNTPPAGASIQNAFQSGFFYPPDTLVGSGLTTAFRNWVTPFNHQWNVSIQRMVARHLLIEAAYTGNRGQRIWMDRSQTAVSTSYLSLGTALDDLVPNPYYGVIKTGALSAETVRRSALLQPFSQYTNVTRFRDPVGDSVYHGLTLRVERKMGHGFTLQASYTASKGIDNVRERFQGRSSIINPNDMRISRSVTEWDRPQFLVTNFIYELPFGPGKRWLRSGVLPRVIGIWQVSGVATLGKGLPVVITGPNNTRLPGVSAAALRLKDPVLPDGQQTLDRWFDTTAFAPAPSFSLGSDSRTQPRLRTPGMKTADLSISRTQTIRERVRLQFRAEMFSAFNTPQFGDPNGSVTSVDFGRVTSATGTRNVQLGLRLSY